MSKIESTEALEKYLQLERDNKALQTELTICRHELTKMRAAYSGISSKVDLIFEWLSSTENMKTETVRRKMAETFKFAYMEGQFEDMRVKWPNQDAANTFRNNPVEEGKTE